LTDRSGDVNEVAERLLREKRARRRQLAALPIEEKVAIVVQMQRMANDIRRKTGRQPLPEWTPPGYSGTT